MRTEEYAYIVLTSAALLFPSRDRQPEKMVVRAAAQSGGAIGTESPMPMTSEQDSLSTALTTRMIIDSRH
jgi:hypothetical protein